MDIVTFTSLPRADQVRLKNSAKAAQRLEDLWTGRIIAALADLTPAMLTSLEQTGKPLPVDFEALFIEHFFDVTIEAMRFAVSETEEHAYIPRRAGRSLALPPKAKIPNSLAEVMKLYDLWRRGKYKPKRAVVQAKEIKKEYLERVRSAWEKYSEPFRRGEVGSQQEVREKIQEAAQTTGSRAKTIVRTETTNYYNQARKEFYDESQDITHYLFIAIRDAATSQWCTPRTIDGYRGRSGLVYAKSDPLCDKERPGCHWNCRSEYLPLNRLNPAHLKFIQDLSIQRRRHTCYPLPNGWRAA